MHYIAPIPILLGLIGVIGGYLWLVAAGSDEDGGPDTGMLFLFGRLYIALRVLKVLSYDPMSVLPAFGLIVGGGALIALGIWML